MDIFSSPLPFTITNNQSQCYAGQCDMRSCPAGSPGCVCHVPGTCGPRDLQKAIAAIIGVVVPLAILAAIGTAIYINCWRKRQQQQQSQQYQQQQQQQQQPVPTQEVKPTFPVSTAGTAQQNYPPPGTAPHQYAAVPQPVPAPQQYVAVPQPVPAPQQYAAVPQPVVVPAPQAVPVPQPVVVPVPQPVAPPPPPVDAEIVVPFVPVPPPSL